MVHFFIKYDCDLVCTYILDIFTISDKNLLAYWAFPQALFTVELEIGLQIEALHEKYQKVKSKKSDKSNCKGKRLSKYSLEKSPVYGGSRGLLQEDQSA